MNRWATQVSGGMQEESPESDGGFEDQNGSANIDERTRDAGDERNRKEADRNRTRKDGNPLQAKEESIVRVIGETENEVTNESTERQEENPLRPFGSLWIDHAVHDQKKSQTRICEWRRERRGVGEAANGSFIEEVTFKMQYHSGESHNHGRPTDYV